MPLLMSRIIDVGIANRDVGYIGRIGLLMVVLALFAIVCGVIFMRLSTVGSMGFGANLRRRTLREGPAVLLHQYRPVQYRILVTALPTTSTTSR